MGAFLETFSDMSEGQWTMSKVCSEGTNCAPELQSSDLSEVN